jgi:hypothetical protein
MVGLHFSLALLYHIVVLVWMYYLKGLPAVTPWTFGGAVHFNGDLQLTEFLQVAMFFSSPALLQSYPYITPLLALSPFAREALTQPSW